jgi:hypothetical protein
MKLSASTRSGLFIQGKVLLLLLGLAVVTIAPMLEQNYPINHSTHFNLSWVFQYQQQFLSGQLYPRWLEFSNFGFGNATFAFYYPLCMVATLPFRLLGLEFPASLIASMGLAAALLGLGMYLYARCFYPLWIAAGVAALSMLSPYFLVDMYARGSIGEVWAIVALPWVLWTTQLVIDRSPQVWTILAVALAYGVLILSHLLALMLMTPLWIVLPWLVAQSNRWSTAKRCYVAFLLACGWTAFYLLPVVLDQPFLQLDLLTPTPEYEPQNRLMLTGLWRLRPQLTSHWFDKQLVGFWWGMVLTVILGWIVYGLSRLPKTASRSASFTQQRIVLYWLLISTIALLMTTDLLAWVYSIVTPLARIQFSWRWLTITAVTTPLLLGYLLDQAVLLSARQRQRALAWGLAAIVFGLTVSTVAQGQWVMEQTQYEPETIARFAQLATAKQFPAEPEQRPGETILDWHWIFPDGLALVDAPEYRVQGVTLPMPPDRVYPLLEWQDGALGSLTVDRWEYGLRQFHADNPTAEPQRVSLRTFYYPAWRLQIDGKSVETEKTAAGQLQVTIPPGAHRVTVRYLGTATDWLGRSVTLLTAIGIVIWLAMLHLKSHAVDRALKSDAVRSQWSD